MLPLQILFNTSQWLEFGSFQSAFLGSTCLCWKSDHTATAHGSIIVLSYFWLCKACEIFGRLLNLACTFSGNCTRADHKGVAGETDCESTPSMGSSHHLHWAHQGRSSFVLLEAAFSRNSMTRPVKIHVLWMRVWFQVWLACAESTLQLLDP